MSPVHLKSHSAQDAQPAFPKRSYKATSSGSETLGRSELAIQSDLVTYLLPAKPLRASASFKPAKSHLYDRSDIEHLSAPERPASAIVDTRNVNSHPLQVTLQPSNVGTSYDTWAEANATSQQRAMHLNAARTPGYPQQIWHSEQAVAHSQSAEEAHEAHLIAARNPFHPQKIEHANLAIHFAFNDKSKHDAYLQACKIPQNPEKIQHAAMALSYARTTKQEFDAHLQAGTNTKHPNKIWHIDQAITFAEAPYQRFSAYLQGAKTPEHPLRYEFLEKARQYASTRQAHYKVNLQGGQMYKNPHRVNNIDQAFDLATTPEQHYQVNMAQAKLASNSFAKSLWHLGLAIDNAHTHEHLYDAHLWAAQQEFNVYRGYSAEIAIAHSGGDPYKEFVALKNALQVKGIFGADEKIKRMHEIAYSHPYLKLLIPNGLEPHFAGLSLT